MKNSVGRPKGVKDSTSRKKKGAWKARTFIGTKMGRWTILETIESNNRRTKFKLKCDCGTEAIRHYETIAYGKSLSCGCLHGELMSERQIKYDSAFNKVLNRYKGSAKLRNLKFELSKDEFIEFTQLDCYYCESGHSLHEVTVGSDYKYNGIDRVNNDIGYIKTNCVTCCKSCNKLKRDVSANIIIKAYEFLRGK